MPAINTFLFAFRTVILNKFLLDFVTAPIAGELWVLEESGFRIDLDARFYGEIVFENIIVNLSLWERCVSAGPDASCEEVADLGLDDDSFIGMGFVYF